MYHTNVSYRHDADTVSLGSVSSNRQYLSSPGRVRRANDQAAVISENSPRTGNDKKNEDNHSLEQTVPNDGKKTEDSIDDDSYYSLKRLRESRRGNRDEDSGLSRRVRRFYKDQDELIDIYERIRAAGQGGDGENISDEKLIHARTQKMSSILTKVSLAANIVLFILKIVGAVVSKSLSVVSSVIDSAVDLATSVILFWAWRIIKKRDKYRYPQGRTRLEPIAILILAVIMCAASVFVIYESINTIIDDSKYFTERNSTHTLSEINMSTFPIVVMVVTAVGKAILFFLCNRVDTPTMSALSADHRNDVVSNIFALVFGLVGSFAYKNTINQKAIFVDPAGAIVISIYIINTWIRQAKDQIQRLSGHTADPRFLSHITWLTYNHSPLIMKIDTVRAFYFGTAYLVEVDIVLPEDMLVKQAHDIGESLQKRIEDLPDVERAFVHIDYEYNHNPTIEHKVV